MTNIGFAGIISGSALLISISLTAAHAQSNDHNKVCRSAFDKNKSSIERFAMSQNSDGIRGVFVKAGCPETEVNLDKSPATNDKKMTISCSFSIPPPKVTCTLTFGAAIRLPTGILVDQKPIPMTDSAATQTPK